MEIVCFKQIKCVFLPEQEVFMRKKLSIFMILCLCFLAFNIPAYAASGTAPQTTTKTTKKVTTKKVTMKKAATKTETTTKKTTTKKKTIQKNGSVTTVTETTTVTTVKTSIKKKSKTKTIETTVVTTVKTTKTTSTPTTTTTKNPEFSISKFSNIKGHVDSKIYNAFVNLGFQLKIDPSLSTTGAFSVEHWLIQLKKGSSSYLLHELGHFLSALKGGSGKYADQSGEFSKIFNEEKALYHGNNQSYITKDTGEYFAESFRDYTEDAAALKKQRPKTYNYINSLINSLSDSDITAFKNRYSWMW